MFDINTINKRYFDIKLSVVLTKIVDGVEVEKKVNLKLEVEPPKVKMLKKLVSLSKNRNEDAMDDLTITIGKILSKNKAGQKVSDEVMDELDYDQLTGILDAYFDWLGKEKNSPN